MKIFYEPKTEPGENKFLNKHLLDEQTKIAALREVAQSRPYL